ncbi:MAG TPA: rhodanese-like domain-containing protein [Thermoanaerobaculia bacterium]|jgi:hypothetical protein
MAKRVHNESTSSRTPLIVLAIGGVLVAALVVWAVTRSVEPVPRDTSPIASAPITPSTPASGPMTDPAMANSTTMAQQQVPQQMPPPAQTSTLSPLPDIVPPPGTMNAEASVARISAEDLREKVGRGEVTVIDVRDAASYATGHIPGAIHMQMASVEGQLSYIPRDKPIVTYCT